MRILLISWHYEDGSSEGLCAGRVASALALRGHRVTVLANATAEAVTRDTRQSSVEVVRVQAPQESHRWWRRLNAGQASSQLVRGLSAVLNLRHFADAEQWSWVEEAAAVAGRLVGEARQAGKAFEVVFSRLNPQMSHQAARLLIKAEPELGWCAYFSDPWPHFLYPEPFSYRAGRGSRRRGLEVLHSVYSEAGALLFPSERLANYMTDPAVVGTGAAVDSARGKLHLAPHAAPTMSVDAVVDEAMQAQVETGALLRIRHAGFLMGERKIDALLEALATLPLEIRGQLRVEFAGRMGADGPPRVDGLEDTVSVLPPMSPAEALAWMKGATVSLLVESDFGEGIFMPSKFADYAALGHPILALSPDEGTVADYLAVGGGVRAKPADVGQIGEALLELHGRWVDGSLSELAPSAELARQFSPDAVAERVELALVAAAESAATG